MIDIKMLDEELVKRVSSNAFGTLVRLLAVGQLHDCKSLDMKILENVKTDMTGSDEALSTSIVLDAASILCTEKGSSLKLSSNNSSVAVLVSQMYGVKAQSGSIEEVSNYVSSILDLNNPIEGKIENIEKNEEIMEEAEESTEDLEAEEDSRELNDTEGDIQEEEDIQEDTQEQEDTLDDSDKSIYEYYEDKCNFVVEQLILRYTDLFSSGYELSRPDGILCSDGIVKISGNERVAHDASDSAAGLYDVAKSLITFVELPDRSNNLIASYINSYYRNGSKSLLYFPNKMLEYAYGLEFAKGDNANSLKTYNRHAKASSWKSYVSGALEKSVSTTIQRVLVAFVKSYMQEHNIEDYRNNAVRESIFEFLSYARDCLSLCFLFPKYKIVKPGGKKSIAEFKFRVCDPTKSLLNKNITPIIIEKIALGQRGKIPHSYAPLVKEDSLVVEYTHEFNHNLSQAVPLFAYKALDIVLKNSKEDGGSGKLTWDSMILGINEDGTILKSVPSSDDTGKGIKLSNNLTHDITAGSRAGKGVMTLNILASAIASGKNIFYLDRKPDMSSLFKHLSPTMFVINGADYQEQYDFFKTWTPKETDSLIGTVPDEVLDAFEVSATWSNLGDLVYMRALKLVIGIIMLRGSFDSPSKELGGTDGIVCVVDEFTNFQNSYMKILSKLTKYIPNIKIEEARQKLEEGKITQSAFDRAYNNRNYYALSYMLSAIKDIEYIDNKKRAGFNPMEVAYSDVFVIGQDIQYGEFKYNDFKDSFQQSSSSARKKSVDGTALNASGFQTGTQSIPYSVVNFKTADAFFGRNDQGYLAAGDKNSKANGKLDDKASNFAYMSSFTESIREKMDANKGSDNLELSKKCKYFKPFLILNSSGLEDQCVKAMFQRVETNAGVSAEELTAENPSFNDPNRINEAIGFIDYIKMAGCDDVQGVLAKSSSVANYVVKNILKYPGDWMQFVTDFSPEWLFTIEDIVLAGTEGDCPLFHPESNEVLKEYYDFNPERFCGSYQDDSERSINAFDSFLSTDSSAEDYSDDEEMERMENERMAFAQGDEDYYDEDEEIPEEEPIHSIELADDEELVNSTEDINSINNNEDMKRALDLIEQLNKMGLSVQVNGVTDNLNEDNPMSPSQAFQSDVKLYEPSETTEFGEDIAVLDYMNEEECLNSLVEKITEDVLNKFGASRIRSFRVVGGSIVVNESVYTCKVNRTYANRVPYDIRKDINSGNISKLFNYKSIYSMTNLTTLEFESSDFVYNYVSPDMGFGVNVAVNKFFENIQTLRVLKIKNEVFNKHDYLEKIKGNDTFYKPRLSTALADGAEEYMRKFSSKCWSFSKDSFNNKNHGTARRVLGTVAGGVGGLVVGTTHKGVQAGRGLIKGASAFKKGFKQGLDELFNK